MKPHTLVTFLGKGRDNPTTGYRPATYRLPDGSEETTPFFGLALARHLRPDELVILGTSGSMWDVLIEHLSVGGDDDLRLDLMQAVADKRVEQSLLDRVQPLAERGLGRPAQLRLITYGREESEQRHIVADLAEAIPKGKVSFDVTHAFRHLGMLGLVSAFFLERVGKLDVAGLYYGALDMTTEGVTPVLRLDGLNAIQRWVDALDRFDATGDYGVFAPLLVQDGVREDKARCLEAAAFHERTFNLADARRKLLTFLPSLDETLPGASGLFQKKLTERLRWVHEGELHEHQRRLAYVYLNRRDYVRAAVLAWEATITRECSQSGLDAEDFSEDGDRAQAETALRARLKKEDMIWAESPHRHLKDLRNSLAHGSPPWSGALRKALSDPLELHKQLEADMKRTLG